VIFALIIREKLFAFASRPFIFFDQMFYALFGLKIAKKN